MTVRVYVAFPARVGDTMAAPPGSRAPGAPERWMMLATAARVYAAKVDRTGSCEKRDLVDHGFNQDFVTRHFAAIKDAGEIIVADARRRADRAPPSLGRSKGFARR